MEGILYILIGCALHASYKSAWYKFSENNNRESFNTYVSVTIVFIILSAFGWLLISCFFYNIITSMLGLSIHAVIMLVIYSASMEILACYNAYVGIQYKYQSFIKVSAINAVCNVFLSIVLICTIFSRNRSVGRMLGTTIPVVCLAFVISVFFIRNERPKKYRFYLQWGLKYSFPIVPNGIGQTILGQFDRIMINKMISSSAAGVYSFAYNIFGLVNVTAISLDNAWSPWLFEKMNGKDYVAIKKESKVYLIMMMLFSALVILLSPELVKVLGSKEYWEASYCVIPIVAGGYFSFMSSLPISVEYYYEKTKMIAVATLCAAFINAVSNWFLIKKIGYVSAAYTTLFTYMLYFTFHYIFAKQIHGNNLFPNSTILFCSICIVLIDVFSLGFIDVLVVRWIVAFAIAILFLTIEEKNIGICNKMLAKIKMFIKSSNQ
jgi:O-antigen/teichoic acid export membrane protein